MESNVSFLFNRSVSLLNVFLFFGKRSLEIWATLWGLSGFAEQRNLKRICRGIRNSSNFSAERRNSSHLPHADFHENDKRNAELS